ncbi:MAG: hypothetical protein ACI8Z5_000018 [Lentimonas sp.]|jgi:hypothetical protein
MTVKFVVVRCLSASRSTAMRSSQTRKKRGDTGEGQTLRGPRWRGYLKLYCERDGAHPKCNFKALKNRHAARLRWRFAVPVYF